MLCNLTLITHIIHKLERFISPANITQNKIR